MKKEMTEISPKVTIIMATYNRADLITEALNSIKNQTFKDWECLIIDDGSTDATEGRVSGFVRADVRFYYFKRSAQYHKGLPGSRNMGLDLATGKYVIFFDDDDIVHPRNLETCVFFLENFSKSFCRYDKRPFIKKPEIADLEEPHHIPVQEFDVSRIDEMITGALPFSSCSVMWRKDCFKETRFNEELMYAEEWECYARILLEGFDGITINQVLYYNRKHANSNTGEFYSKDVFRRGSYIKAIKLVINHLHRKEFLSSKLEHFFIRLGFFLDDYSIIGFILKKTNAGILKRFKYIAGYRFYPVIRPVLLLKKRIKDQLS